MLSKSVRAPRGSTCVRCRKMKLRCDAPQQFPAACSRCARGKKHCQFGSSSPSDGSHMPMPRLGVDEGQAYLSIDAAQIKRSSSYSGVEDTRSDISTRLTTSSECSPQGLLDTRALQPQTLGGVELTPGDFIELLDIFFADYHPRLPFLPSKRSVLEDCQTCPLLYWSIAAIAAQASPRHAKPRTRLVWPVRRLAAEASLVRPSLPIVQALLLLCAWPLPFSALVDDPSWTFIGIAIQKGLQIGLHGSKSMVSRGSHASEEITRSSQSTWLTSIILHHTLGIRFSSPSALSIDSSIIESQISGPGELPPVLVAASSISQKDTTISSLLTQGGAMTLQVIKLFESDLDGIKKRFERDWDLLLENQLACVKMRLYSLFLSRSGSGISGNQGDRRRRQPQSTLSGEVATYVSRAYQTAIGIIKTSLESVQLAEKPSPITAGSVAGSDSSATKLSSWTSIEFQSFIFATFVLFDLSQRYQPSSDGSEAKTTVHQAWNLLKSCSVVEGDHYNRVCDVIQYLVTRDSPDRGAIDGQEDEGRGMQIPMAVLRRAQTRYHESGTYRKYPVAFPDVEKEEDAGNGSTGANIQQVQQMQPQDIMAAPWDPSASPPADFVGDWNVMAWDSFGLDAMNDLGVGYWGNCL